MNNTAELLFCCQDITIITLKVGRVCYYFMIFYQDLPSSIYKLYESVCYVLSSVYCLSCLSVCLSVYLVFCVTLKDWVCVGQTHLAARPGPSSPTLTSVNLIYYVYYRRRTQKSPREWVEPTWRWHSEP